MGHGKTRPKVAIVTPFPAPYRIPLFNALSVIPDIDLTVLVTEMKGVPNQKWKAEFDKWRFCWVALPSISIRYEWWNFGAAYYPINFTLPHVLLRRRYDVIVTSAWTALASNISLMMSPVTGASIILWETSIPHPPTRLKRLLEPAIKQVIGSYDAWLVASTLSKEYMVSYGASAERVFLMPQVVDFDFFRSSAQQLAEHRDALLNRYDVSGRRVVCFVGQLVERKGVRVLIEAMRLLRDSWPNVTLLVAGMGPMESELKELCRGLGLDDSGVKLLGHVSQDRLPEIYTISDVFALPSYYDTFGAVVLEAMSSGLPVVVTEGVGASRDLVRDGVNGFVVPVNSPARLAEALRRTLADTELCRRMGMASQAILEDWNMERAVQGFCAAVKAVL